MLQPVRAGVPSVLGDRPAVRPRQPRQQSQQERPRPPPRLHPGEPRPEPAHHLVQASPPPVRVYALARGHRKIVCSPHTCGSSSGGRAAPGTDTPKITKSGWSTRELGVARPSPFSRLASAIRPDAPMLALLLAGAGG